MKKLGEINFILEDLIEILSEEGLVSSDIYILFYQTLHKKYKRGRESYEDDSSSPILKITRSNKNLRLSKKVNLSSKTRLIVELLIRKYKEQDLQWGEVLYIVHGYLNIHRPDLNDCEFYYGPKL